MTRETIEIMAALADERKIAKLDRALRYRFSTPYSKIPAEELRENYAYNVIAAAFDYCLDECEIIEMLQDSIDLRTWKVQPKRYHKGYCPIICKSQKSAEHERENLERTTGFEWTITVIPE